MGVDIEKPHVRRARQIDGEGDDSHAPIWDMIHRHGEQITRLERSSSDTARILAEIKTSIALFDSKLVEQFLRHEARESATQMKAIVYGVGLLIAAFGALAYFVLSRVAMAGVA